MKTLATRLLEAARAVRDRDAEGEGASFWEALETLYAVLDEIEQQETGKDVTE